MHTRRVKLLVPTVKEIRCLGLGGGIGIGCIEMWIATAARVLEPLSSSISHASQKACVLRSGHCVVGIGPYDCDSVGGVFGM